MYCCKALQSVRLCVSCAGKSLHTDGKNFGGELFVRITDLAQERLGAGDSRRGFGDLVLWQQRLGQRNLGLGF